MEVPNENQQGKQISIFEEENETGIRFVKLKLL